MAANTNPNSSPQAAATRAKARLEQLLDTSYAKIEELRQLLIKESNLQWKDCTKEIEPVIHRQRILHEKVMLRLIQATGMGLDDTSKITGRSTHGQSNIARTNTSVPHVQKPSLPHSYSLPSVGQPTLPTREIPRFDAIRELRRDESAHLLTKYIKERTDGGQLQIKDDRQWYGSLDRNMAKKKKRGPVDKARRHTKIVGSMAALERTDELQPDEQYKIGLPNLTRLDSLTSRTLQAPRVSPPLTNYRHQPSPSPPPLPPPKSRNIATSKSVPALLPEATASLVKTQSVRHLIAETSSNPVGPLGALNKKTCSAGWLETSLDESVYFSAEGSPATALGFDTGSLDTTDSIARPALASPATDISEKSSKSSEGNDVRIFLNETIKPFEMADYYKYSTKYRQSQSVNQNQIGNLGKSDILNANVVVVSAFDNENPDHTNTRLYVPKLPRDVPKNPKLNPKPGAVSYADTLPTVPRGSIEDSDLGWVMDTPTLV